MSGVLSIHAKKITSYNTRCYINRDTYINDAHLHRIHRDILIQIHSPTRWCFYSESLTHLGINLATYDNLRTLIDLYIFPSTCRCFDIHLTNSIYINISTCEVVSGHTAIHNNIITFCYISRHTSINVEMSEFEYFKQR